MSPKTLPSDPLAALGSGTFAAICEYLPYSTLVITDNYGIWRSACCRFGVSPERIAQLRKVERIAAARREAERLAKLREAEQGMDGALPPCALDVPEEKVVDWRELCREHVLPEINWPKGHCQSFFVQPPKGASVAHFVIDEEDQTCIMLLSGGGLLVVDVKSSEPLFSMPNVAAGGRLDICRGLVLLRTSLSDSCIRVFRTRSAIARSSSPWSADDELVGEAQSSTLLADPEWCPSAVLRPAPDETSIDDPPPPSAIGRGCLAYWRSINLPQDHLASRVKVMGEGSDREETVLCTVERDRISFWDVEKVDVPAKVTAYSPGLINSPIDFDEDYVFLSEYNQLAILCRSTGDIRMSFPPALKPGPLQCAVAYGMQPARPNLKSTGNLDGASGLSRPVRLYGHQQGDIGWRDVALREDEGGNGVQRMRPSGGYSACYTTGNDLVLAHPSGHLLVVRDYAAVLASPGWTERINRWNRQSIFLEIGTSIHGLSLHGPHIAVNTLRSGGRRTLFFRTDELPSLPLPAKSSPQSDDPGLVAWYLSDDPVVPIIELHETQRVNARVYEILGAPQVYPGAIYSLYQADDVRGRHAIPGAMPPKVPCIRRLAFGPISAASCM